MCKRYLALIIVILIATPIIGCGLKNIMPNKAVPPLESYNTVVIAPFAFKKAATKYNDFPTLLSYGIGTKLSVRFQEKTWIYNQSQDLSPVTNKLKELNLSSSDIYNNPEAAAKLAEAFNADLVVTGIIEEPKITKEESSKVRYDMSQSGPTGAARYYTIYQTVLLKSDLKVIEPKAKSALWNGRLVGYKKYETKYLTGNNPIIVEDATMLADIRKAYSEEVSKKLYPSAQ